MAVREDCRHYSTRSTAGGIVQRCRLNVNETAPFACPVDCLFIESRSITDAGWRRVQPSDGDPAAPPDDSKG